MMRKNGCNIITIITIKVFVTGKNNTIVIVFMYEFTFKLCICYFM